MKAMVLDGVSTVSHSPLAMREVETPAPGEREIRVRVRCCAVCRTDLHVIEGDLPQAKQPIIPGHQIVGVVDQRGKGASRFKEGNRVGVAWLRHTCGTCRFCARGQENLCESSRFTGYHADGGYAEYAVVPEDYAYTIPDVFSDVEAAPLLCSGIIGYRALRRCSLPRGGTLALYGFGSSAHVVFQIAKHRGSRIFVVTRGEGHQALAREMGADWVSDTPEGMPDKADSAILFAPVGHLVPPALEALRKGGTLALAGICMTDVPAMNYERHLFYERAIHSVTANTREDGRALLDEAAEVPVRPHTSVYSLEEANRALQDLKADRINGSGVLMVSKE
jgi:propanol-preferring alcohol dehydrogenase